MASGGRRGVGTAGGRSLGTVDGYTEACLAWGSPPLDPPGTPLDPSWDPSETLLGPL